MSAINTHHWPTPPRWLRRSPDQRGGRKSDGSGFDHLTGQQLISGPVPQQGSRNNWSVRAFGYLARLHRDDEGAYDAAWLALYESHLRPTGYPLSRAERTAESAWKMEQAKAEVTVPELWHDGRPTIDVTEREPIEVASDAWTVVEAANEPPAKFRSGGVPVRVEQDDDEQPTLNPLTPARMKYEASRVAAFVRVQKDGRVVAVGAPTEAVSMMLANPEPPLPVLTRIVAAPVFGRNGELQTDPGYHGASRTLYAPKPGFEVDPVTEAPPAQEIEWAVGVMRDLLCDFPFVADADLAHALALWLLPFARDLIDGPTPMHLFDKPAPGTGAGLLAEVLMIPALGTALPSMGECRDDDEYRKRLTAKFMAGAQVMMFDNLEGQLRSPVLAAALTQRVWEDRILGASQIGKWPIRTVWIATANNLQMNRDLSRRCVRIRLDSAEERPWERTGFAHHLPAHAYGIRADAVWAALTLISGWLAAGRPAWSGKPLGSYEDWSAVIGGVLEFAGVEGFLDPESMASMYEDADTESADIAWLAELWWSRFEEGATKTADLRKAMVESGGCPIDLGYGEQTQTIRLGVYLKKLNGRRLTLDNGRVVTIQKGGKSSSSRWKLTEVGRQPEPVQQEIGL